MGVLEGLLVVRLAGSRVVPRGLGFAGIVRGFWSFQLCGWIDLDDEEIVEKKTRRYGPLSSSCACWPGDQMLRRFRGTEDSTLNT